MDILNIFQCEEEAKDEGFDSLKFIAIFPAGPKVCTWLDAYMGIFKVEGMEGSLMTRMIDKQFPKLECFIIKDDDAK